MILTVLTDLYKKSDFPFISTFHLTVVADNIIYNGKKNEKNAKKAFSLVT